MYEIAFIYIRTNHNALYFMANLLVSPAIIFYQTLWSETVCMGTSFSVSGTWLAACSA